MDDNTRKAIKHSFYDYMRELSLWILFAFILLLPALASGTLDSYVLINSPGQSGNTTFYNVTSNTTRTVSNATTTPLAYKIGSNANNGQYLIIMTDGWVWASNNSGNTLRNISVNVAFDSFDSNEFDRICMSDDGRYQYFSYLSSIGNLRVYRSTNYGNTWNYTDISVTAINDGGSIGCSPNGQFVVVNFGVGGSINYVRGSSDYATTFTYYSNTESGFGSNAYEWYVTDSGVEIISNRHIYNTATSVITNYSKSILAHHIYYDQSNGAIIALSSTCNGYFIDGSIALNSSYTAITDFSASTQCYSINSEQHMTSIYAMAGNAMYYTGDYGQSWTLVRSFIDGTKYSFGLETFGSTQVNNITPQCISNNTYCTNPYMLYGQIVCQQNDTLYCNAGCSGTTCSNTVANECNIQGSRKCVDTTTYAVCSDSNADSALDFGETHTCALGDYCVGSFNYAECQTIPSSNIYNQSIPYVTPYSTSDENTAYVVDSSSRTVAVTTTNLLHTQGFYTTAGASTFIGRTCNYKEVIVLDTTVGVLNSTYDNVLLSAVSSSSYITINLTPVDLIPVTINIKDSIGSSMGDLIIVRNSSAKQLCLKYLNGTDIYCDYSTNTFDDLSGVKITFTYDFVSMTYSNRFDITRAISYKLITSPTLFAGNNINEIIINTTNATVGKLNIYTTTQFPSYTPMISNDASFLPCTYTAPGSYKVRTYSSTAGYPEYSIYTDYTVNVKTLGASSGEVSGAKGQSGLSTGWKYFIFFGILVFVILGSWFLAGIEDKMGKIVGVVLAFIWTVISAIPEVPLVGGLIPGWFAVFIIILTIIVGVIMTVNSSNNGGY